MRPVRDHPRARPAIGRFAGRSFLSGAVFLLAALGATGCGTTRPDPPPYPQVGARAEHVPLWTNTSIGKALPGFLPAVVDGAVWAASESGEIAIVDAADGRLRTTIRLDARLTAGIGTDGRLQVVVSRDGDVIALDAAGKRLWSSPLKAEIITQPAVGRQIVAVRTVDGRIVALDRADGLVKWTWKQASLPALTLRQSAPPVFSEDLLFAGLPGGKVIALDTTLGAPRWETTIATSRGATELERLIDVAGSPVVEADRVCAIAFQGRVACLRRDDGRITWARDVSSGTGIDIAGDQIATVDGGDLVRALRIGGEDSWKQDAYVRRVMSAPAFVGAKLALTDRFGSLHVIDAENGLPLARIEPDGSAFTGRPVVVDRVLYAQTIGGSLIALALR